MSRRIATGIISLLTLIVTGAPARAADAEHLRFVRPIEIAARTADELVAVRLDAAIMAATAEGYPDLRILDVDGRETSRVIRRATAVTMRSVRTSFVVDRPRVRPLPGEGLEIVFTIDAEKHPDGIDGFRIDTPLTNFEQDVRIERQDATGAWSPVGDDTLLYDYSQFMNTRQTDVAFPGKRHEPAGGAWRITVKETTLEQQAMLMELVRTLDERGEKERREKVTIVRQPFRIDRIAAWRDDEVAELRTADAVDHPVSDVRVEDEPEEKRTRIRLGGGRVPTTALRLDVADRNFGRPARVEVPRVKKTTREAARGPLVLGAARIHRVDLRGISREALAVEFPESRGAEYEIVIANGDSQPLDVTGVTAVGPEYEAVFLARPGASYRLAYGGATDDGLPFPQPRYDTTAIDTALAAGRAPSPATLGPIEERKVEPVEPPLAARIFGNPWLIGTAIALLAVILALSLAAAARRLGPPGDESSGASVS